MNRWKMCAVALGLLTVACGDPLGPFQPEVTNAPDSFQLQATDVTGATTTRTYEWVNSGVVADVDHSTTTLAGEARLVIRAADGTQVYDSPLTPSLNEQTATGATGTWVIQLILSDFSGTLNFRVQKP